MAAYITGTSQLYLLLLSGVYIWGKTHLFPGVIRTMAISDIKNAGPCDKHHRKVTKKTNFT